MKKHYLITVRSQLLDLMLFVRHTIGDQHIVVLADSIEQASRAAVSFLGDNHTVYHLDDHPDESSCFSPSEMHKNPDCALPEGCGLGFAIYWPDLRLRHTSIRATVISEDEVQEHFSITCGINNGVIVQA